MKDNAPIFSITSSYCLKTILSYIDYSTTLKLVKYNKHLQNKIDINIKDYSLDYELKEEKTETSYSTFIWYFIFTTHTLLIFSLHFYQFIYSIFYLSVKPYKNKKRIEKIEKYFQESFGKSKIYHKIQTLETYILVINSLLFFFSCCGFCTAADDCFKVDAIIWFTPMDIPLQSIFFGINLWLLYEAYFIYENQKSNSIILNLLLIVIFIFVFFVFSLALFIVNNKFRYKKVKKFYLKKFQGININTLKIDDNFCKMNSEEKKRYILSKTKEMTFMNYGNEENVKNILSQINEYRKENKLDNLKYFDRIPEFVINGNSLVKFTINNIFKIGKKKYLFKYPSGEFLKQLNAKNKNILNILSLDYLSEIKIVIKDNNEYILVYDDRNDEHIQVHSDTSISEREDIHSQTEFKIVLKN